MGCHQLSTNRITFFNVLSTVFLQGITFFTTPLFSRMLGAENYGIVSIYTTWVTVVVAVFGLQTGSTLGVARNQYEGVELKKYQSSILGLSIFSYTAFSFIVFIAIDPVSRILNMSSAMCMVLLFQGFGQYCVNFINGKFTYDFSADKNFLLSISNTSFSVFFSIKLIQHISPESNYWGRILGMAIVYILMGIGICICIFKDGKTFFDSKYWGFCLPLSLPIIFHVLSHTILNQCDRIMLQNLTDNTTVGIYSLAATFSSVLSVIWNSLNNSWVPFYYEYTRKEQIMEMKKHACNYIELFTVLSIGFLLLAPEVFHVFAESEYWSGTGLISVLGFGFYMVFLYSFPVNFEFYNKRTKTIALGTISAAIANILLNIIMIRIAGAFGAALATVFAHILQFLFHHICAKYIIKHVEYPFTLKFFLPYILLFSLISLLSVFTNDRFAVWRWLLGILIGVYELRRIIKRKAIF